MQFSYIFNRSWIEIKIYFRYEILGRNNAVVKLGYGAGKLLTMSTLEEVKCSYSGSTPFNISIFYMLTQFTYQSLKMISIQLQLIQITPFFQSLFLPNFNHTGKRIQVTHSVPSSGQELSILNLPKKLFLN